MGNLCCSIRQKNINCCLGKRQKIYQPLNHDGNKNLQNLLNQAFKWTYKYPGQRI